MSGSSMYDSLQMAYEFIEQADKLADSSEYGAAYVALEKAKTYAFNNKALLDDIQGRYDALKKAQKQFVKGLEAEAADLFNKDRFDGQKARKVLQVLLQQNGQSQLAQSLWAELPTREAAERERRLVDEFQQELEGIWQRARELEESGAGSRAVAEYEQALVEASKKVGDAPTVISFQHLKLMAAEKRDQAKDRWVGTPTLILTRKGEELIDRYEALKQQGETETEFFDENGEFLGRLPVDECIDRAKKMASRFAEQKAQDYLDQARQLLAESPGAAYEKIQEALSIAHPSDFAKSILEQELKDKIEPAMQRREEALAQAKAALGQKDPIEAWLTVYEAERIDKFTPGIEDARQRLLPMVEQEFANLLEAGQQYRAIEDFQKARIRFQGAVEIAQMMFVYDATYQEWYSKAQKAFEDCLQFESDLEQFNQRLDDIAQLSQSEPEQAKEQLTALATQDLLASARAKVERLQVQIGLQIGVDQLYNTLEQKMFEAKDGTELIAIEEGVRQAHLDYPDEERFPRLIDRIIGRRAFLKGSELCEDPQHFLEAQELLQEVIEYDGDDAATAQALLDKIAANEQQEADIAMALQVAFSSLENDDAHSAYLLLEPYRHVVSHQASQVQKMISMAVIRWRSEIDRQLEELVNTGNLSLPKVESLLQQLERSQSPRLAEWQRRALVPAYVNTARDLQELNHWNQAGNLWEEAFRFAPNDPEILEGRRNARKHLALVQAEVSSNPVERENLLDDLNRLYSDDLTIKRYLAEFYYNQNRFVEARLVVAQAKFLADVVTSPLSADVEAIRQLEILVEATEDFEKRKSAIRSQLRDRTSFNDLREARRAYEQLLKATPGKVEELEGWWADLIEETVNEMMSQIVKLSDTVGTALARTELLFKVVALQPRPEFQAQAERMLILSYSQLPSEIRSVVGNPEGVGYGSAERALTNHIAKAKDLHNKLVNMSQVKRVALDLGIAFPESTVDLNKALYELELTLEKLYFAQEKHREIKSQIDVAMMTGKWETVHDSLNELKRKHLSQHRGLQEISVEVTKAKHKRTNLEAAIAQIKAAMLLEKFKTVQNRLQYMVAEDPNDEMRLQASLEVVDPYTGLKVKGQQELSSLVAEKLAVFNTLRQWQTNCQPPVNWQIVRARMMGLADGGNFVSAIRLGQSVKGENDEHQGMLQTTSWSWGHVREYLATPPLPREQLNSSHAETMVEQANQQVQILLKHISECDLLIVELQQKEKQFKQILSQLAPLLQQIDKLKKSRSPKFSSSAEDQDIKRQLISLVERGRQLCPTYSVFVKFEENNL